MHTQSDHFVCVCTAVVTVTILYSLHYAYDLIQLLIRLREGIFINGLQQNASTMWHPSVWVAMELHLRKVTISLALEQPLMWLCRLMWEWQFLSQQLLLKMVSAGGALWPFLHLIVHLTQTVASLPLCAGCYSISVSSGRHDYCSRQSRSNWNRGSCNHCDDGPPKILLWASFM